MSGYRSPTLPQSSLVILLAEARVRLQRALRTADGTLETMAIAKEYRERDWYASGSAMSWAAEEAQMAHELLDKAHDLVARAAADAARHLARGGGQDD